MRGSVLASSGGIRYRALDTCGVLPQMKGNTIMADMIQIPEMYKNYIYPEKRNMPYNPNVINTYFSEITISQSQALEDFATFKYLIDNAYSGRDYWAMRGVDFPKLYAQIEGVIKAHDHLPATLFRDTIYQTFLGKIVDNHLSLRVYNDEHGYCFSATKQAYFTGIIVEEQKGKYVVVQSDHKGIHTGDIIECADDFLFPTLAPTGKNWFYVGARDWIPVERLSVGVNGRETIIPLHKSKAGEYVPTDEFFKLTSCLDIPTVLSGTFYDIYDHVSRDCGVEYGHQLKNEKQVMWVLAGNGGGSSIFAERFVEALNGYANSSTHAAYLETHITNFSKVNLCSPYTNWQFYIDPPMDYSQSKFEGTLFTLMNHDTGSAAENAVGYAKSVKNHILIGENSGGIGLFGEVQGYLLRHSMIRLGIPCAIFLNGVAEGEGYNPDYWIDSADLVGEVARWIRGKKEDSSVKEGV